MLNATVGLGGPISPPAGAQESPMVLHSRVVTGFGGGPDKTILNSPRFLRPLGYNSVCMYLRSPHDEPFCELRQRASDLGAPLEEVDDSGALDWKVVPAALEVCKRLNVRIWHGHDYKTNVLGLVLNRWWPMRLVTTVHGWVRHTRRTPVYYKLDRWALKRYESVMCVSPDLLDRCRGFGVPEKSLLLIENAIDCQRVRRDLTRAEAKRCLGLPADGFLIGAVGRLSPEKGFDRLIAAVERLRSSGHCPMLAIIGDGDQREELRSLIRQAGLDTHVRLTGFQSDTAVWYQAMDVFALSSLREGLPNVVLEAMAYQTPVVATRVAGVPRLIEEGRTGVTVPIGDVEALAHALVGLMRDGHLRERLAEGGRRMIEKHYSFHARMKRVAGVYQSLGVCPGGAAPTAAIGAVDVSD